MKYNINLINRKGLGLFDKALYFFLNYLRYILVVTQVVVIGVLFYRFSVDQRIIDLRESIEQKKAIVDAVKPIIAEAERANYQINEAKKIVANQKAFTDSFAYLLSIFPESASLSRLDVSKGGITLEGTTPNPKELQLFYNKLKKDRRFSSVELADVRREQSNYTFLLTLGGFSN